MHHALLSLLDSIGDEVVREAAAALQIPDTAHTMDELRQALAGDGITGQTWYWFEDREQDNGQVRPTYVAQHSVCVVTPLHRWPMEYAEPF